MRCISEPKPHRIQKEYLLEFNRSMDLLFRDDPNKDADQESSEEEEEEAEQDIFVLRGRRGAAYSGLSPCPISSAWLSWWSRLGAAFQRLCKHLRHAMPSHRLYT